MSNIKNLTEHSLNLLRSLPRISLANIGNLKYSAKKKVSRRGDCRGSCSGRGKSRRISYFPLGSECKKTPFFLMFQEENYYKNRLLRREYPPLTLAALQRMIDLNRVDTTKPIDLAAICRTGLYRCDNSSNHFGINLTDEGADKFNAKINIEVQWASEPVIAAIERNGGVITTAYYDVRSVGILANPKRFFESGESIPKRMLPPDDAILFYTSAATRGYLANPDEISWERLVLSQKYGYRLSKLEEDPDYEMLTLKKDPRQIFFGLEPGWVVNLKDQVILKCTNSDVGEFVKS